MSQKVHGNENGEKNNATVVSGMRRSGESKKIKRSFESNAKMRECIG
jgi:hypothetical protein